jgi:hypothetical protein
MPKGPGAVLWPNSKTSRSKPDWWATRTATSWAWLLAFPPVVRGHAAAGDDPGLADAVGVAVAVVVGRAVGVGDEGAAVGLGDREADAVGVAVGDEATSGWGPHALTTTMPMARASAA